MSLNSYNTTVYKHYAYLQMKKPKLIHLFSDSTNTYEITSMS